VVFIFFCRVWVGPTVFKVRFHDQLNDFRGRPRFEPISAVARLITRLDAGMSPARTTSLPSDRIASVNTSLRIYPIRNVKVCMCSRWHAPLQLVPLGTRNKKSTIMQWKSAWHFSTSKPLRSREPNEPKTTFGDLATGSYAPWSNFANMWS
jgi:hypothetical protein